MKIISIIIMFLFPITASATECDFLENMAKKVMRGYQEGLSLDAYHEAIDLLAKEGEINSQREFVLKMMGVEAYNLPNSDSKEQIDAIVKMYGSLWALRCYKSQIISYQ